MPRLDFISIRYIASFASIAVGVGLLIFVALDDGKGKPEAAAQVQPARTTAVDAAPTIAIPPTPQSIVVPVGPPLVKGTEADCFTGWRFVDNPQQRWTMCLPLNLLAFDGKAVLPFENASATDQQRIFRDFAVVNEPWFLGTAATLASADVLGPMSLRVDVVGPTAAADGCAIRQQAADVNGALSCKDRLQFSATGSPVFAPDGSYQRYRGLVPTQTGKSPNEVFSLQLTIFSYAVNGSLQDRLFASILESLKPY